MTVSPGDLDSLLNMTYPVADFGGLAIQSRMASAGTVTTTRTIGPDLVSSETFKIVAVGHQQTSA
jgi:hypothetical protein